MMTVEKAVEEFRKAEAQIRDLLTDLTRETGLQVTDVDLDRHAVFAADGSEAATAYTVVLLGRV